MKFDLKGYNIDNLLKTLYVRKITLFNVQKTGRNQVSFEILEKDYKKVKRHIANFKVKQTFSSIKRFPKFILANLGVVVGCFIGIIFGIFASNYTWQIMVYGTEELSNGDILAVLSENGVKKGKINLQTSEEIEEILLNHYDRIAQVSVIREGTAIIINLSEKLVYNEIEFQPITAKYCGIVKEINIVTGTTNVKVGDYVNVGDVLVLPFNINSNGEKVSVMPIAEITGEIFAVSKCEMKKIEQVLVKTGRVQKVYKYKLKNLNLFSGKSKNSFALFETNVYNENISGLVPLNRDVYVYQELETQYVERDFAVEEANLVQKSKEKAYENLPVGTILTEKSETSIVGETMYAITTIVVNGEIC
ncbi:MAG: sporulation protein YqfD [Clostridia bacterium]|nr:sporulation protein YqfD [Clostridia bacterium]